MSASLACCGSARVGSTCVQDALELTRTKIMPTVNRQGRVKRKPLGREQFEQKVRFGSVRFGSVRFDFYFIFFGLVWFGSVRFGSVRFDFYFIFGLVWFGSVRFGSGLVIPGMASPLRDYTHAFGAKLL